MESGKNWEEGFCDGLVQSRVFIPIVSASALLGHHNDECRSRGCESTHKGDTSKLTRTSDCDNVILEYRLALELKERGLIEEVLPLLAGPVFDESLVGSNAIVASIEDKLKEHLKRQGLGEPVLDPMSPKETFLFPSFRLSATPPAAVFQSATVESALAWMNRAAFAE